MKKTESGFYTLSQAARFLRTSYGRLAYAIFRTQTRSAGAVPHIEWKDTPKGPLFTRAQLLAFAKKARLRRPKRSRSKRRRALAKKFLGETVWR